MELATVGSLAFLLIGVILGISALSVLIVPRCGWTWTAIELAVTAIVGAVIVQNLAFQLPGGPFAFVYCGLAIALINQVPKWYFSGGQGSEVLEMIGCIPPTIFVAFMFAVSAWTMALGAASLFCVQPTNMDAYIGEALLLALMSFVSVVISLITRVIEV